MLLHDLIEALCLEVLRNPALLQREVYADRDGIAYRITEVCGDLPLGALTIFSPEV